MGFHGLILFVGTGMSANLPLGEPRTNSVQSFQIIRLVEAECCRRRATGYAPVAAASTSSARQFQGRRREMPAPPIFTAAALGTDACVDALSPRVHRYSVAIRWPFCLCCQRQGDRLVEFANRMGGRVVEGTGLENRQTCKRLEGSNPSPSASYSRKLLKQ